MQSIAALSLLYCTSRRKAYTYTHAHIGTHTRGHTKLTGCSSHSAPRSPRVRRSSHLVRLCSRLPLSLLLFSSPLFCLGGDCGALREWPTYRVEVCSGLCPFRLSLFSLCLSLRLGLFSASFLALLDFSLFSRFLSLSRTHTHTHTHIHTYTHHHLLRGVNKQRSV